MFDHEMIPHRAIHEQIANYTEACEQIDKAYELLAQAKDTLQQTFGMKYSSDWQTLPHGYGYRYARDPSEAQSEVRQTLHRQTWRFFIDVLGIKKVLSTSRAKELDEQLETGKLPDGSTLPELTPENVMGTIAALIEGADSFSNEVILEAFDILTPHSKQYKTNCGWKIGPKVILSSFVNPYYGGWRLWSWSHSDKTQILNVLDRAFHLLDGKGIPGGYTGPLADAIQTIQGTSGETEYFKFKCYKKGTLHLEFKRADLLKELNRIAGENGRRQMGG